MLTASVTIAHIIKNVKSCWESALVRKTGGKTMNKPFKHLLAGEKLKNAAVFVFAVVLVAAGFFWFGKDSLDHIEDTNGDDISLQVITEQQIVERSIGALGGPNVLRSSILGSTVEFSAKKYTGVTEILYDNYILPSDFVLDLINYEILGGNFQLVVVHDDKIVAVLEPGTFVHYRMDDITGYVSLRIVGESAAFKFSMSEFDLDMHTHNHQQLD
jgi:hypothetical protein